YSSCTSLFPYTTLFRSGLATGIGAAISMAYSEGLSDTGEFTGRGRPVKRGLITSGGTFLGGILHTLPFLIPAYHAAIVTAAIVVDRKSTRLNSSHQIIS